MSVVSDILYSALSCLTCFQSPELKINHNRYRIKKLLGEGGFSYVYLVENVNNRSEYALKKIRCSFGPESLQQSIKEIDSYKLFKSHYVIRAVDSAIIQESDGSKTVYIVLPYFKRGNLQDLVNSNLVDGKNMNEVRILKLTLEICKALRVLHKHQMISPQLTNTNEISDETYGSGDINLQEFVDDQEEEEGLLSKSSNLNDGESGSDGIVPYAHRDIKPANIMLDGHGRPVLMDFGSCSRARMTLETRQQALELQDLAAEHCTIPYRAPELFDVKTGSSVDERVDIWSLGCTIYSLMYNASPFELQTAESGASLNLAIMNGQYKFPNNNQNYSEDIKNVVKACLTLEPTKRPFIDDVIKLTEEALAGHEL